MFFAKTSSCLRLGCENFIYRSSSGSILFYLINIMLLGNILSGFQKITDHDQLGTLRV